MTVFVVSTPLHLLYALALVRVLAVVDYEVHWFGRPLDRLSPALEPLVDALGRRLVDESGSGLTSFSGFLRDGHGYATRTRHRLGRVEHLFTCYEIHYAAECLRHAFRIPWPSVGIVEDGISNYYPHSMMRRRLQVPKAAASVVSHRHPLTLARHNLGGNPRIGAVSTIGPAHVHVARPATTEIIDIAAAVRAFLDEIAVPSPDAYLEADSLLFLPAVLNYGRMTERELLEYVVTMRGVLAGHGCTTLAVKPHPREDAARVREVLAPLGAAVAVGDDAPTELYMHDLDHAVWAGSPSTVMLNKHLLYPGRTRYLVTPLPGNRYVETQAETLRAILGDRYVDGGVTSNTRAT